MDGSRQELTMDGSFPWYFRLSGECQWYPILLVSLLASAWDEANADGTHKFWGIWRTLERVSILSSSDTMTWTAGWYQLLGSMVVLNLGGDCSTLTENWRTLQFQLVIDCTEKGDKRLGGRETKEAFENCFHTSLAFEFNGQFGCIVGIDHVYLACNIY